MGYFLNKFHIKPLFEAEVDGENTDSDTEDYTADDSAEADTAKETEQPADDNPTNEDNKDDNAENTDENQDDNDQQDDNSDETTDYTEDFDDQDGEGGSDEGEDNSDSGSDSGDGEEAEVDELKKKEEELYSNLSPEQLDIKHKELKTQFLEMYDITGSIIERITDITVNEDNLQAVEYMSDSLADLRRMLADYMDSVYATKSYTENSINYNRFLAVLNGINQMLEELLKNKEK